MSKIIFLNGCSSAGKTSIAKEIQRLSTSPWLHIGIDTFIGMLPAQYIEFGEKADQGYYSFKKVETVSGESVHVKTEPLGMPFFNQVVPKTGALMADLNQDIIIDEVMFDDVSLHNYRDHLQLHTVYLVKVSCELSILQDRERNRGNRVLGLVNDQFERLQLYEYAYDLTVDTSYISPTECTQRILTALALSI